MSRSVILLLVYLQYRKKKTYYKLGSGSFCEKPVSMVDREEALFHGTSSVAKVTFNFVNTVVGSGILAIPHALYGTSSPHPCSVCV